MSPMPITHLPPAVQSPDQLQFCADEVRRYGEQLAQAGRRTSAGRAEAAQTAGTTPQPEQLAALSDASRGLLALLPEKQPAAAAAIEQLASQLDTLLQASPTVHLSLAATPPASLRVELTQWFREAVHPTTLVSFHVNPELAGGMTLRTLNRSYDFSFRTPLLARTDSFTKVLAGAT